jgi:hypothetical protein
MSKTIVRIGAGAGFQGDRIEPAVLLAAQGKLDYLALECLAERTIALAALRRLNDPQAGYDDLLEERLEPLLPLIARHRIKLVTNMGAANPLAAGRAVQRLAARLGLRLKIAVLSGDDVRAALTPAMRTLEGGKPLGDYGEIVSANAYLGAESIVPALALDADVVITGRVADPSLFVAPLVHAYGWRLDDWPRLARATVVGHLLECAGQLTGGYFADPGKKDVGGLAHLGFPFADVDAEGNAEFGKVAGTGGTLNLLTAKEQLFYEVTDPTAYTTPDVVADFTQIELAQAAPDRVRATGAVGKPRTPTYKVSVGYRAGWMGEGEISYAGPNAVARARLACAILRERLLDDVPNLRADLIGVDAVHRTDFAYPHEPYEARVRIAGTASARRLAERIGREVEALGTNGPAGGGGFTRRVMEKIGIVSILLPRSQVHSEVSVFDSSGAAQTA